MLHAITHELVSILTWPEHQGYNFWSGNTAPNPWDLPILAVFWHRHNCHEEGCWRIVRHGHTHCKRHAG